MKSRKKAQAATPLGLDTQLAAVPQSGEGGGEATVQFPDVARAERDQRGAIKKSAIAQ